MEAKALTARLIGGMALPQGVLLMSEERVALGYHDAQGRLQLYTRDLNPHWARRAGPAGTLGLLLLESLRAWWRTQQGQGEVRVILAGALAGAPLGLLLRAQALLPAWQLSLLSLALLALVIGSLYRLYAPFRQALWHSRRYHGAEHMAVYALEAGQAMSLEGLRRQPILHPFCGTNLAALWLMAFPLVLLLPVWLQPLIVLPLLPVFGWMARNKDRPLAGKLVAIGYWGQRYTVAHPEERHLEAALKAVEGLGLARGVDVCGDAGLVGSASA
ncbi:hypothetical protein Mterra_02589 [Calidithermus terrae]|uniref:DUF1385 domain-containing protein n=1 Tax=Calidithermus terrae TaxID=1408545 RepID=A0A399EHS7_9DEIN|nr:MULTISPECIES: DUF1385 domain-containing protein [Calidithermus]RIH82629.1 hypothetical protein Mterra_02589 [Calidithermus terrae]